MNRRLVLVLVCVAAWNLVPSQAGASVSTSALPQTRLEFGLANDPGHLSWMTQSGVPWAYRYQYLSAGVNTGKGWETWNSPPGAFATYYMNDSNANGYIPVFSYYELLQSNPSTGANESDRDFSNLNNSATMSAYYANFKLLMQLAGAYGKAVVVHVEPDLWGYLQQRAAGGDASTLTASVASSGFADVSGFPNTAQGFGRGLVKIRDLYAPNVLLAIHASGWASGIDINSSTDPTVNAVAVADSTAAFLNSAGNSTGSTWDLVFNDVDDHDAGWWETQGVNRWFDPSNTRFPNFTRYLAWVSELKAKTGRPQVVWQVPVGNQYFLTMNNTCGHYQDNVAPYFISHPSDLFASGLIAVLFGAGNYCQTTNTDDAPPANDGVTNGGGAPTTDALGGCNACNTHTSTVPDDDGGYLRQFVGQYYIAADCMGSSVAKAYFNWFDKASPGMLNDNIHIVNPGASVSSGCVSVGGQAVASWSAGAGQETYVTAPAGTIGGPVVVTVTSGPTVLASQRVQYYSSFNEVWAQSAAQAATTSYINWYDKASPGMFNDNIHVLNPGTSAATVTVSLPGATSQVLTVAAGAEAYATFPQGTIGGPVTVSSTQAVLASQRVQYYSTFNEVWAQPATQAATISYVNWYDKATPGMFNDNIHVLNPSGSTATVTVAIPGASPQTLNVAAGAEGYATFPHGTIGGPVTVTSTQPVLASQRVQFNQSFNEVWAEGAGQAATSSHVNWYDKASPGMFNDNLHVLNPGGATATVTVTLPGAPTQNLTVAAGGEGYVTFPQGTIGGPVTITSTQPVLAAQRVQYYSTFNEIWAT
jgi:hypothetical protein